MAWTEAQRPKFAVKTKPFQPIAPSLPLDSPRRLEGDVVDNAVDVLDLIRVSPSSPHPHPEVLSRVFAGRASKGSRNEAVDYASPFV